MEAHPVLKIFGWFAGKAKEELKDQITTTTNNAITFMKNNKGQIINAAVDTVTNIGKNEKNQMGNQDPLIKESDKYLALPKPFPDEHDQYREKRWFNPVLNKAKIIFSNKWDEQFRIHSPTYNPLNNSEEIPAYDAIQSNSVVNQEDNNSIVKIEVIASNKLEESVEKMETE